MKKIGILLRENDNYKVINKELINYLSNYDVSLLGIIYDEKTDLNKVIELINLCDGVILPGGDENLNYPVRIAKYLWEIDKPTLGICLGMQNMAQAISGKIEKLDTNFHNSKLNYVHKISIKKESLLYEILGSSSILVNSRHFYHVIKTNLSISAYSDDYVIEAVEDKNKKFYLGIQWHPESLNDDINSKLIIDEFISKC